MATKRLRALGPLLAGEGCRAFIGLEISKQGRADPVVLVWVPEGADKDPALLERIRRETEHAAKLDHQSTPEAISSVQKSADEARTAAQKVQSDIKTLGDVKSAAALR